VRCSFSLRHFADNNSTPVIRKRNSDMLAAEAEDRSDASEPESAPPPPKKSKTAKNVAEDDAYVALDEEEEELNLALGGDENDPDSE
jgi:hypothetical protein